MNVKEKSSALVTGVLKDENGAPLGLADVDTLTATLYDKTSGAIINGRNAQTIKNANGGEVDAAGNFKLHLSANDNVIIDGTIIGVEPHVLIVEWTYAVGKTGKEVFLVDVENLSRYKATPTGRTFLNYVDEVKLKVSDDAGKLSHEAIVSALHAAVTQYGKEKPFKVFKRLQGNDTSIYPLTLLGDLYEIGFSRVVSVHAPWGTGSLFTLEPTEWQIVDDGTAQDGSNLVLQLVGRIARSSEYINVEFTYQPRIFEKAVSGKYQNFPDTAEHFANITNLAAANCCLTLAAAYAPSSDATINADVVNYQDKSRKYSELARNYLKRYTQMVFGSEEPTTQVAAAIVDVDVDTTLDGRDFLFHPRRRVTL
jgi:hypothetical protein